MGLFMANEPGELSEVRTFTSSIAGAEYNVAVGISRLGHEAAYCTRLGFDPMGEKILRGMRENGISTELVMQAEDALTGFMLKSFTEKGDPKIAYYRRNSAASQISAHDMDKLDLYGCEYLHVTGITPALSQSALSAIRRLMERARALDMVISFDPNLRPQLWESEQKMVSTLNSLAEGVDIVLPGRGEGKILCGTDIPEEIAAFYHSLGVKNVVVKLGKDGAYYSAACGHSHGGEADESHAETGYIPAFPESKKVDTVGAGDGFAAGVLSAVMEGLSLKEAAFRGNVIGAIQITNKSDNEGLPTREQLEEVIRRGIAGVPPEA